MTSHIIASFAVHAGTTDELDLNLGGMTPDQIAAAIEQTAAPDTTLCHQCGSAISDPEIGDLTGFTVNGRDYERGPDGSWVESAP